MANVAHDRFAADSWQGNNDVFDAGPGMGVKQISIELDIGTDNLGAGDLWKFIKLSKNTEVRYARLTVDDLDMLIPHQANLRINEAVARALGLTPDRCHNNVQTFGNTTSATIPLCMKEAVDLGKIRPGDLVCLVSFGAGLTWGSILLRY